mmetsp:Transcript_106654/g.270841  ORF Transcript_106654/g.270841 Transcript_106654/m.270841 type:complete len:437 (-) Transcript_106654:54-1364(-)
MSAVMPLLLQALLLLSWFIVTALGKRKAAGCPCADPFWQKVEAMLSDSLVTHSDVMDKLRRIDLLDRLSAKLAGENSTADCLGAVVGSAMSLAVIEGRTGHAGKAHSFLLGGVKLLPLVAHCFDDSPWPFTTEEILNNYRLLNKEMNACAWGVDLGICLESIKRWDWSVGGMGAIPRILLGKIVRPSSPWKSVVEAMDQYIYWIEKGVTLEALYWKSFLARNVDKKPGTQWVRPELADEWTYIDPCSYVEGTKAPRILNVGSGPIVPETVQCGGRKVPIVSADGLADVFWRLYDLEDFLPPWLPMQCYFEQLATCFGHDYFHLVHVRNALDHAFDLPAAILQLVAVTRLGGTVVLHHARNEAHHEKGQGMHSWSFDLSVQGRPVVRYLDKWLWDLTSALEYKAEVSVQLQQREELPSPEKAMGREEFVLITLRKLP